MKEKMETLFGDVMPEKEIDTETCSFVDDAKEAILKLEEELEEERVWGSNADLFCNSCCTRFLGNLLERLGTTEIEKTDLFHTILKFFTKSEIEALYSEIMPPFDELARSEMNSSEKMPDLQKGSTPWDYFYYFNKYIGTRTKMWKVLAKACTERSFEFLDRRNYGKDPREASLLEKRFYELQELFGLEDREMEMLLCIYLCQHDVLELGDLNHFSNYSDPTAVPTLAKLLGVQVFEIEEMLRPDRNIRKFGLLDEDMCIEESFSYYLQGTSSVPLTDRFWTKYEGAALPWKFYGKTVEKHGELLKQMIRCKTPDQGHSVLLYGVAGAGKTSFAVSLARETGKDVYFIAHRTEGERNQCSTAFRYAALAVAQRQLDPQKCILVVDECDKMVENQHLHHGFFQALDLPMIQSRDGETKARLNMVMDENCHTVLWICNSMQDLIDPSSRRRFDYSIFFDEISPVVRKQIWHNVLEQYGCTEKVSEDFLLKVSRAWHVNPGGIAVAVRNAAAVFPGDCGTADFETVLMNYLRAHCSLLGIRETTEEKFEPAQNYTLEGLNIRSGLKLPRLVSACRKFLETLEIPGKNPDQPRMNLLLFGVPGSGKTEFVKFLAKKLGKRLNVKSAADLLSQYVGGTEERLASAFAEAEANGEILFIDEGDSMLGSRTNARNMWEVSQVNTLLSEMERFRGIFIVSTNLIQNLDPAAIRRFNFRLHFDYLDNHGKEIFYENFFATLNLPALTAAEKRKLNAIENLTPSDFRNVRQQYFYLEDEVLTNGEVLEALAAETAGKNAASDYKKLGETASRIGFGC